MAIVQISRITNRRGLQQDLPQLSPGELGWCLDTRLLFIGNGTIEEGSPALGNTEVLTEYSDIKRLIEEADGPLQFNIAGVRTLADAQLSFTDSGLNFPGTATGVKMDYQIRRTASTRVGTMTITLGGPLLINYGDDYVEDTDTGIVLQPQFSSGLYKIFYTSTATGNSAEFTASVRYFR
jgi:hypothetical protein